MIEPPRLSRTLPGVDLDLLGSDSVRTSKRCEVVLDTQASPRGIIAPRQHALPGDLRRRCSASATSGSSAMEGVFTAIGVCWHHGKTKVDGVHIVAEAGQGTHVCAVRLRPVAGRHRCPLNRALTTDRFPGVALNGAAHRQAVVPQELGSKPTCVFPTSRRLTSGTRPP